MAQQLDLKLQGLNTNPSPLKTKPGTLSKADNISILSPNTYTCRRGFNSYGNVNNIDTLWEFEDKIIGKVGTTLYRDNGSGTLTAYSGTYTQVDSAIGIRSIQSNGSVFINTTNGIYKLDTIAGTWLAAGVPKAIGVDWSLTGTGSWFLTNNQVAYRVVWGYTDNNGIVTLGTPSERVEVKNEDTTSDGQDVVLSIYIPDGITTSYFYQIYRSGLSGAEDTVANDELQLVYEDFPTSAEISAGVITITDVTPDTLRGATIYTAATQEGIENSNDLPPVAKDMTVYKGYALYANTATRHRKYLTLLSVGGDGGVGIGDVITIGGIAFTGAAAQDHSAGEFAIVTTGTAAENIRDTARSLAQVINRYSTNTVTYAYYISGYDDLPGKLVIEARTLSASSFNISFTNATTDDHSKAWNPTLTSAITSNNETKTNRIYISKPDQVDSVPVASYIDAGSGNSEILRIIALRDSVFIFKDDGEIYRLVGDVKENFALSLFDNTTTLIAPKTAVSFTNQIYTFSDQGIVAVSDAGIAIKSWDIQDIARWAITNSNFLSSAVAVAYESESMYILYTGTTALERFDLAGACLVYNTLTNAWTTWGFTTATSPLSFIVLKNDDKLYFGSATKIRKENKGNGNADYIDGQSTATIDSVSGADIILTGVAAGLAVGDYLYQYVSPTREYLSKVTAIDDEEITVEDSLNWSEDTVYYGTPIAIEVKFLPIHAENPGIMKRFSKLTALFRSRIPECDILFLTNFEGDTAVTQSLTTDYATLANPSSLRTFFPLTMQRALWVILEFQSDAEFWKFEMNGLSLVFDETSERFTG